MANVKNRASGLAEVLRRLNTDNPPSEYDIQGALIDLAEELKRDVLEEIKDDAKHTSKRGELR